MSNLYLHVKILFGRQNIFWWKLIGPQFLGLFVWVPSCKSLFGLGSIHKYRKVKHLIWNSDFGLVHQRTLVKLKTRLHPAFQKNFSHFPKQFWKIILVIIKAMGADGDFDVPPSFDRVVLSFPLFDFNSILVDLCLFV